MQAICGTTIDLYTEDIASDITNTVDTATSNFDGVSIAITILAVIAIAGTAFFYLIPKK